MPVLRQNISILRQGFVTECSRGRASASGQIGKMALQSWVSNAYRVGSVEQVISKLLDIATSFWPFAGGNPSANGTANEPATRALFSN